MMDNRTMRQKHTVSWKLGKETKKYLGSKMNTHCNKPKKINSNLLTVNFTLFGKDKICSEQALSGVFLVAKHTLNKGDDLCLRHVEHVFHNQLIDQLNKVTKATENFKEGYMN